jgi:hypothetical protein
MASQADIYLAPRVKRVAPISLPKPRQGGRPDTTDVIPHQQLNQWPEKEIVDRLWLRSLSFRNVQVRQSRMALPETRALSLMDEFAGGPPEAFIDSHEFCHIHPTPQGSVHLTLPAPFRQLIVQLGWAEPHPMVRAGCVTDSLVMVYAPRNDEELTVILDLIGVSRDFAAGAF